MSRRKPLPDAPAQLPPGGKMLGTILALDVSSSAIGYAAGSLSKPAIVFGVIRPKRRGDPSIDRIDSMIGQLAEVVGALPTPLAAVMEWSSGKVHRRIVGRAPSGMAVLGQAQGQVRQWVLDLVPLAFDRCEVVTENEWTRSRSKQRRAAVIRSVYPDYAAFADSGVGDSGLDAADAIGLLDWFRARERTRAILESATSAGRVAETIAPGEDRS